MPRRKKHEKLPNGYGQIRFLGKKRRNPYGVYPPAIEEYDNGKKKTPPALCYVSGWDVGLAVLVSYHAGTYTPGDEVMIEQNMRPDSGINDVFFKKLVSDYNKKMFNSEPAADKPKFSEVFEKSYKRKFGKEYGYKGRKSSSEARVISGYKNVEALHHRIFEELKADDLQEALDATLKTHKKATAESVKLLYNQMYKYAVPNNIVSMNYAEYVSVNAKNDREKGVPFSTEELKILWKNKDNDIVEMLLIMCYSGFRIEAYRTLEVNLKEGYFKGGVKNDCSKNRIVPIHSGIMPLVKKRINREGALLPTTKGTFRKKMYETLDIIGIEKHTPHDCRHTFSKLCERFEVKENDRKRMLGHAFSDMTNKVYGHRELEDLRHEIEKIQIEQ